MNTSQSHPCTETGPNSPSSPQAPRFTAAEWASTPSPTAALMSSFTARARKIATTLGGFIRADMLDSAEAEIVSAQADLWELRIHVRQLRAAAKAERRAA